MLVDQSLKARVFAKRIPGWIELEHWDGEAVGDDQQMIEQTKRLISFARPGVNLGECSDPSRPIERVLRFR